MKRIVLFFSLYILLLNCPLPLVAEQRKIDGYPLANFALTVNAGADGSLFGAVLQNTGRLGEWLMDRGCVNLFLESSGRPYALTDFSDRHIERLFPFVRGYYAEHPALRSQLRTLAFCPLQVGQAAVSALPVVLLQLTFSLPDAGTESFHLLIDAEADNCAVSLHAGAPQMGPLRIPVEVSGGKKTVLQLAIAFYDSEWTSARHFANAGETAQFAGKNWDTLLAGTQDFEHHIPTTDDTELDTYLRWYTMPAVALTRITRSDEVLTMGYSELNQRDSYWTSWLHLVFYPQLEKKMLAESIQFQQPSGKIPTCILPLIEREDDLDINAFFILRAGRFYDYYHDLSLLETWWEALEKAMDWLVARDTRKDGIPAQASMWGDWKDVAGISDRLYSPFATMTYLAALDRMTKMAMALGDTQAAARYRLAYDKGSAFINRNTQEGGLWNGHYYCQIRQDGSVNQRLLQDQMIGVFYGVVPTERAVSIIEALNKQSLTPYGIAETTPYYPAEWGYAPGTYHNGGVWPWLSFMDSWARLKIGRREEAVELVKRIARADLLMPGDWSPNEDINSLTGENIGFQIQGWNAALFGMALELTSDKSLPKISTDLFPMSENSPENLANFLPMSENVPYFLRQNPTRLFSSR
jgi:hypothetical protein